MLNINEIISSFLDDLIKNFSNEKKNYERENQIDAFKTKIKPIMDDISILFKCLLYSYLSPKKLIKKLRINQMTFDYIIKMIKLKFKNSFIPVGEMVGAHIDEGTYYLDKDRYHLSIQGQYKYFVGNEDIVVDAGTLLWFNNKIPHGTVNLGDETRITFVFDVPHG